MSGWRRGAATVMAAGTLMSAGIAFFVWTRPRLFDGTPGGVGRLLAARCTDGVDTGCTVSVLALSPGRYWIEASSPQADRVSLRVIMVAIAAGVMLDGVGDAVRRAGLHWSARSYRK